jgi:hypothetical protein
VGELVAEMGGVRDRVFIFVCTFLKALLSCELEHSDDEIHPDNVTASIMRRCSNFNAMTDPL